MSGQGARLRAAALLAAGAVGVHELRYLIAYRDVAGEQMAHEGHAYLSAITPLLGLFLACALGHFLGLLARHPGRARGRPPDFTRLWSIATGCLLVIYVLQESLEGALAPGHPAGVVGVFGNGGWVALLLALAVGLLVALALRGAADAIALASRRRDARPRGRGERRLLLPACVDLPRLEPIGRHLAGRAPPRLSG